MLSRSITVQFTYYCFSCFLLTFELNTIVDYLHQVSEKFILIALI